MTEHGLDTEADDTHQQLTAYLAFLRNVLRHWYVFAGVLVVGAVACGAFLTIRKPTYRSETVILYSEGVRSSEDEELPETSRSVAVRFKEILMARASLETVVREFDLYPDIKKERGPVDAVEELRKHIEHRAPGGDTFSIAFTGASPMEAKRVTTRLAELVLERDSELRKTRAVVTRDFMETEEGRTEAELRAAEQELATFMGEHPRFAFDATPAATGAAFRASVPSTTAPVRQWAAPRPRDDKIAALVTSGAPLPRSGPVDSGEAARAAAALAAAKTNLAELTTRFTPAHPDVRAAAAEVQRAESRLLAARTGVEPPPETTAPAAPTPSAAPSAAPAPRPVARATAPAPAPARSAEPTAVSLETEWVRLTRAVTEARVHHDQIEAVLFKASIAANSESGGHGAQVTIIDPAFLPEKPVPPGRMVIAGVFLGIAVVLGIFGAILAALFDDRVHAGRDLARMLPLLAEVPRTGWRAHVPG
jgi:protein tyrosine kinase modulator